MNNFKFSAAEVVLIESQPLSVCPACKQGLRERTITCNDPVPAFLRPEPLNLPQNKRVAI